MRKITLMGLCIILIVAGAGCARKDSIELCIDSDIYSELMDNMSCFELVDYHNKIVNMCMSIAQEDSETGHYNKRIYNECYKPELKLHIRMLMDKQCEAEGR